ncbi:hypothetical protein CBL_03230 [Carabus blaptoides fortunei]
MKGHGLSINFDKQRKVNIRNSNTEQSGIPYRIVQHDYGGGWLWLAERGLRRILGDRCMLETNAHRLPRTRTCLKYVVRSNYKYRHWQDWTAEVYTRNDELNGSWVSSASRLVKNRILVGSSSECRALSDVLSSNNTVWALGQWFPNNIVRNIKLK